MRCLGRTETDRKITNEPWSSKRSLTEQRRPLFGVKGVVCPKKEKREQKFIKKVLTRAGIVRDVAYNETIEIPAPQTGAMVTCIASLYLIKFLQLQVNMLNAFLNTHHCLPTSPTSDSPIAPRAVQECPRPHPSTTQKTCRTLPFLSSHLPFSRTPAPVPAPRAPQWAHSPPLPPNPRSSEIPTLLALPVRLPGRLRLSHTPGTNSSKTYCSLTLPTHTAKPPPVPRSLSPPLPVASVPTVPAMSANS